jgi:hypothetical protein
MSAHAILPHNPAKNHKKKLIFPVAAKYHAGIMTISDGNGIKLLSIVIKTNIQK